MKPNFALNLSHEGIVLLHRSPRDTWTEVGEVALDDPNLRENLSFLRSTAVGLEGKGFGSKLILPDSQILYLEVDAPGPGEAERMAQIVKALEGKTPYEVADLSIDWTGAGPNVQVAVVANVTLDEAEEFAVIHRFNPISFASRTSDEPDAWEPFFGRTDFSFTLFGADVDVRETPAIAPVTNADLNLFQGGGNSTPKVGETSAEPQSAEDTSNFFEPEVDAPTDENIFSQDEKQAEPEAQIGEDQTPEPEEPSGGKAAQSPDATPVPVSFSSRRQPGDTPAIDTTQRPLDRVAPRIDITPDLPAEPADAPSSTVGPTEGSTIVAQEEASEPASEPNRMVAEDRLRASLLGEEDKAEKTSKLATLKRLSPILAGLGSHAKSGTKRFAGLAATALATLRSRSKKTAETDAQPETGVSGAISEPTEKPDLSDQPDKRKRLVLYSAAALIVLGLLGLVYAFSSSDRVSETAGGDVGTLSTTAASSGVRQDNRPQARPSDFALTVAKHADNSEANDPLKPIRPQRRSVFEGGIDPEANLPDTAQTAINLTEQELADIQAAGLTPPTQEEIAESGDGLESGQMTAEELAATYEQSGILQGIAALPKQDPDLDRDDIFVAALDRSLKANDAIILPDFNDGVQDDPPAKKRSPLAADTVFELDERGLVVASKDGTLNPDGILVFQGKPAAAPPKKPTTGSFAPPKPIASIKPRPRPENLKTGEDAIYVQGKMTLAQLRTAKPKPRPKSEQAELTQGDNTVSELAVLTSFQPAKRPSDFDKTVEKTRIKTASTAPSTGKTTGTGLKINTGPVLPTRASVAKTATIKNAINLAQINLIGVYGSPSKRAALLRLPSGRFVRVKVGDRVDGGRVAAIDTGSLSYVKKGRNRVLKVPQ